MASSADEFMPTAKTMGGGTGGHGMLGSLPPWAVGIGGGALAGREVGDRAVFELDAGVGHVFMLAEEAHADGRH